MIILKVKISLNLYKHLQAGCQSDFHEFELKQLNTSKGFQASNLLIPRKIMNQENTGENQQTPNHKQPTSALPSEQSRSLPPDQRIVEITQPKKKINVIQINDSDQEPPKVEKNVQPRERRPASNPPKPKKMNLKCMICRQVGKKATMKACLDCKGFSHVTCLQQENEQVNRHLCRKCKRKREEKLGLRKIQKGLDDKSTAKRVEKEKKKEEQLKKMGEFQERYPYYFQEEKVKFPIDDKLLFIYKELFEITEVGRPKPKAHPLIPTHLLADFLQIENFFSTFQQQLVVFGKFPQEINKNIFYLSMVSKGFDGIFCSMLEILLNVYLSDIFEKNKTDNVRTLNDHAFFSLMTHLNENQEINQEFLVRGAKQVIRYLATIPSMKIAFDSLAYPEEFQLHQKVNLIVQLIQGLSQIDQFHDLVSIKSEKMQNMTKQKTELIAQLKSDQAQNLSNNEKLKDLNQEGKKMEQVQEGVTRIMTKELDKHKRKMNKLASEQTRFEENIKEIRKKISDIGKVMPFLTSQVLFLGKDKNESEYFFYLREPNRLYVKYRAYLLDNNENFYIYEGKEVITELMKTLNSKGLKEKHLLEGLQSLIKDDIFTNEVNEIDSSSIMLDEQRFQKVEYKDVLKVITELEETFTTYLVVKQYQWASETYRQIFMKQLIDNTDIHILKENLKALQQHFLFAEHATHSNLKKRFEQSEDDLVIKEQIREGRKKIPIRLWGINSQKTKKYWVEYLEESIDVTGVWICASILKNTIDKYVKKKMEAYEEQQAKERKLKHKENRENRENGFQGRRLTRHCDEKYEKKEKTVKSEEPFSEEVIESRRPNLRTRKQKKMNIESDIEIEPEYQEISESSSNEDCCQICQEYGEMICCDTCPKVYHVDCLKMAEVPEGDWSCFKCLEKMSQERQTRSRVKKLGRFL